MVSSLRHILRLGEEIFGDIDNSSRIRTIAHESKSRDRSPWYSEYFPTVRPDKRHDKKCLCAISL